MLGFPGGSVVENPRTNAEVMESTPELDRSPREGNGNPVQCSCLENPTGKGACRLQSMGSQEFGHDLATKLPLPLFS